ncbi:MAG: riboflavin biosynthesis protein RibF [Elusimicrobiota bacterium]|jgi:riboflavin kinase/FMN adenylyltransferase|nr:riboflavin biosynthesis protein RibF [Elusimicrobiota bacterium]
MRKNCITIGAFDGVHLGHRHLVCALKDLARQNNMASCVFAFTVPPKAFLTQGVQLLTTAREKLALLRELGPDKIVQLDFKEVQNISAGGFFDMLLAKYNMVGILAGPDFAFGHNRGGGADFLRRACAQSGVLYARASALKTDGHKISSSAVRRALAAGDVAGAAAILGRPYSVEGKIIKGRQLGRTIGFPTANIDADAAKLLPRGIFAVRVFLGDEVFKGVCNIGIRPTVSNSGLPSVETHILDFDRDIYGRFMRVDFIAKIRDEIKFESLPQLKEQIQKDAARARLLLRAPQP